MKLLSLVAVLLLLSLSPAVLWAADASVTLKEALDRALQQNHLVRGAAYERDAAEREVAVSRSRYFPRIMFDESFGASNSPTRVFMMKLDEGRFTNDDFQIGNLNHPAVHSDFQTSLSLEQPLLDFSVGYLKTMAEKDADRQRELFGQRREDVGFSVFSAYLEVQKARAMLAAAEKDVAEAREHFRVAKVRNEQGVGLKSDELRARTFLSETEQQNITAINDLKLAKMRLALAAGGEAGDYLDIDGDVTTEPFRMSEEEVVHEALQSRPDLKGTAKLVEKADAAVGLARSAWLPTLYADASYQMNDRDIPLGRDNDAWAVGASLRWEIFDGLRRSNDQARARASRQAAAQYQEQLRNEIVLQVRESILRREEAGKRLEVARHAFLAADEATRLVSKRFENGLATIVDLLDSQSALNRTRTGLVKSETDYLLATGRIYYAAGIFLKEIDR
ncbi:RND transporter [Geotalea uraniireducens]|uniref:RND transporter n=1 Tax=Geotalea uraniireducens TaxID=351604 RepID=A0ABM8EG91_9BACT|nr:TolC family protein [Geotalea uraniireducens]BDV41429.1 RND transporter [Geotalea uraniireducens]